MSFIFSIADMNLQSKRSSTGHPIPLNIEPILLITLKLKVNRRQDSRVNNPPIFPYNYENFITRRLVIALSSSHIEYG